MSSKKGSSRKTVSAKPHAEAASHKPKTAAKSKPGKSRSKKK